MIMKRFKLSTQIAVLYISVIIIIGVTLIAVLPLQIRKFFIDEIYTTIEEEQMNFVYNNQQYQLGKGSQLRTVQHMILTIDDFPIISGKNRFIHNNKRQLFANYIKKQIEEKQFKEGRYIFENNENKLFYVLKKIDIDNKSYYLISFMTENYLNKVSKNMYKQVIIVTLLLLGVGTIIFIIWIRFLVAPLKKMQEQVKKIANKQWDTVISLDRKDEIGELANSIEKMKEQLKKQDVAQQEMFQNISHDLKTPISIISNYSMAIIDGIYPYDTLEETAKVILEESDRMLDKVQSILHMNRLNYMSVHKKYTTEEQTDMKILLEKMIERFKTHSNNIKFELELTQCMFEGEEKEWQIAIENIISNMLRYAKSVIKIILKDDLLSIFNDGEQIEKQIMDKMFDPYVRGKSGLIGIGLAITSKICKLYNYNINAINQENGVEFIISKNSKNTNEDIFS